MKKSILLSVFVLALASLACTFFIGGPEFPATAIPVSTEDAASLKQQLEAAATNAAQSGVLNVTITESQLTSLLTTKFAEQSDPLLTDPQVYLRDGQMQIYGKAVQGQLQANVRIVVAISIDADGLPVIDVMSVNFGPLPAPEGMNNAVGTLAQEAFTGALGPAAIGFRLETVTIADGVMTVVGRTK